VLGSEGRGEQILKTDQDNALILADGLALPEAELAAVARRVSDALQQLGWPPCPGDVMITNPLWRQPLAGWLRTLQGWVRGDAGPDGPMHLAMFADAAAVAGDAALLRAARAPLVPLVQGHDTWLARFAAAADQFAEPGNWLTRLTQRAADEPIDLKKLGTFPIVHGARALALQAGIAETGTAARLAALAANGGLDAAFARDLTDALHHFMALRLARGLAGETGPVPPAQLPTLDREALHDALAIVRRFRAHLRQHFHFDAL
jgi:CBS domain-containing protein